MHTRCAVIGDDSALSCAGGALKERQEHEYQRGGGARLQLLRVAILGIMAGSLVGEVPEEGLWRFKLDELLVIAVGIVAIVWYLIGQHRYQRSLVPLALAVVAFAAKVLGVIIEFKDTVEVGDGYGMARAHRVRREGGEPCLLV
jgi:hypothetical protein